MKARRRSATGVVTSRIGRRFLSLFAGCALLPLVVFACLAVTRTTDQMRRELVAALQNGAKTSGMGVAARLSQVAGDLSLARELLRQGHGGNETSIGATLQQHVGERCAALWIVEGERVRTLCGERPTPLPELQPSARSHLQAGKPVALAMGWPSQLLMFRALDANAATSGLVVARIRQEWFWDTEELRAAGCDFAAFDARWQPLFHTFADLPDLQPFRAASLAESSGSVEWQPGGVPHLARFWRVFLKPQYDLDLFVVQTRRLSEALAVSEQFTWWFFATAAGTLLLVVLVSLVQLRRTLGPIVSLQEATRRIAGGELGVRVPICDRDELGELGSAFNDMTSQLQENVRKREQTERDLVTSRDQALAAAKAKAEFVTNVSHEFRTPMTEILSAAEILTQLGEGEAAAREEFSDIALRGAKRLARLLDDVLELGANNVWTMAAVDLPATLRAAVEQLPAKERARVRLEVPAELPCVIGNQDRLIDAWWRLLDNAVKFSPPEAPIDVRVHTGTRDVVVEVVDRGVGIAAADQKRVFEPFCQVGRDQLTDKANGTGLGLTLAQNAVLRHGGRIEVDSEPGMGSTFRVVLPAHAEMPAARV